MQGLIRTGGDFNALIVRVIGMINPLENIAEWIHAALFLILLKEMREGESKNESLSDRKKSDVRYDEKVLF